MTKSRKLVEEKVAALKAEIEAKNAGKKKPEVKAAPKAETKVEVKPEVKVEPKPEVKAAEKPGVTVTKNADGTAEAKVILEAPKPVEKPAMPAEFCLGDQKYWDDFKESMMDPNSNECKTCQTTMQACYDACKVRHDMIHAATGSKKSRATSTTPRQPVKRKDGPTETSRINSMMLTGTPLAEMVSTIASEYYDGDSKRSTFRIKGHIRSVKQGACISAKLFTAEQLAKY